MTSRNKGILLGLVFNFRRPAFLLPYVIVNVLKSITEGTGINAVSRVFNVSKNSIYRWQKRIGDLQETLMLFTLAHQFLQLVIEHLSRVIEQTDDLTLVTDGERRYGNLLFDICHKEIHKGKRGRPRKTLPEGVKIRVKNKGSQSHKKGRKRPKYQAPQSEHPDTKQNIENKAIHANHVEAFNSSLRRLCATYRRKTNTYAKMKEKLQERLDLIWIFRTFVKVHYTTRQIPAVRLGIMEQGLELIDLFSIQSIA